MIWRENSGDFLVANYHFLQLKLPAMQLTKPQTVLPSFLHW
jgi:hypothetical protein